MLITTIYGDIDDSLLEKCVGSQETDAEVITWTEYWQENELVHRSVHMQLKQGIDVFGETAIFS